MKIDTSGLEYSDSILVAIADHTTAGKIPKENILIDTIVLDFDDEQEFGSNGDEFTVIIRGINLVPQRFSTTNDVVLARKHEQRLM